MKKNIIQLHEVNPSQFKNDLVEGVALKVVEILESKKSKSNVVWLTRKELVKLLKVSEVTIITWDKSGILKPFKIGNRIRYKLQDVEQVLNQSRTDSSE